MSGILERLETKMDKLIALIGNGTTAEIGKAMDELATPPEAEFTAEQAVAHKGNADENPMDIVDPYAGTDKDGVTWDVRIHSKAKEPKSVTTGKWKRKKGIQDELYNTVTAELQAVASEPSTEGPFFWQDTVTKVSNTCDTRAEMDELLAIPTTKELTQDEFDALLEVPAVGPKAPLAPKAPSAPVACVVDVPKAPSAPVANPAKAEVLNLIQELTTTFRAEPNDITGLMVEVTTFDTIGKIADDKLIDLALALSKWHDAVADATNAVDGMILIAEPLGFTESLNEGIEGILEPHDADCVGLVHYSAIEGVNDQLQAYLKTWQEL